MQPRKLESERAALLECGEGPPEPSTEHRQRLGLRGVEAAAVPVTCPEGQGGGGRTAPPVVCLTPSLKPDLAWGQIGEGACLPSLPSNLGAWSGASSFLCNQPALFQSRKKSPWGAGMESHPISGPGSPLTCGVPGQGSECGDLSSKAAGGDRLPLRGVVLSTQASGQEATPIPVLPD